MWPSLEAIPEYQCNACQDDIASDYQGKYQVQYDLSWDILIWYHSRIKWDLNCEIFFGVEGIIASNVDMPSRYKDLLIRSDHLSQRINCLIRDTSSMSLALDLENDNEKDNTGYPTNTILSFNKIMDSYSDIIADTGIINLL